MSESKIKDPCSRCKRHMTRSHFSERYGEGLICTKCSASDMRNDDFDRNYDTIEDFA